MKRLILCLLVMFPWHPLPGADPELSKLEFSCEKGQLSFSLEISAPFQDERLEQLKSGLEVVYNLQVEIRRPRKLLPDRVLIERNYSLKARRRPQENDFSFVLMDQNKILEVQHGLSLDQVQRKMTLPPGLTVSGEGKLQPQQEYVFAVRALTGRRYFLGLIPLAVKTPWRQISFIFRQ